MGKSTYDMASATKERTYGAGLGTVKTVISSLTNMMYVPLMLYCMGTSEFGVYQLVGSLIAYIINADFGHCATTRMYTIARMKQDSLEQGRILSFSLLFYAVIASTFCVLGYIVYAYLDDIFVQSLTADEIASVKAIFLLFLVNVAITLPSSVFTSVINSHEKFIFLRILQIGQSILRPITVISFLFFWPYGLTVAIIQTIYNVIYTVIRAFYCYKKLDMQIFFTSFSSLPQKNFIILASSTLFVFFLEQFLWRTNQIILGIGHGVEEVAVYAVASVVFLAYAPFSAAIPSVFFPKITCMVATSCSPKALSDLFIEVGRIQWILLLLILMGFACVGQEFIALWAGPDFKDAYAIALLVMIPFSFELVQSVGCSIMQAQNCYGFRVKVYMVMGLVNLVLAIPFSAMWGGLGCAVALGTVMLSGSGFIMSWYFMKYLQMDMLQFWKEIAKITLVSMPVLPCALFLNIFWPEYHFGTFSLKVVFIIFSYLFCEGIYARLSWAKNTLFLCEPVLKE